MPRCYIGVLCINKQNLCATEAAFKISFSVTNETAKAFTTFANIYLLVTQMQLIVSLQLQESEGKTKEITWLWGFRTGYDCLFSSVKGGLIRRLAHASTTQPNAMRRRSLYSAAGIAVHLLNPAVAGTLSRMLFDNFSCNYSLLANKNQFPLHISCCHLPDYIFQTVLLLRQKSFANLTVHCWIQFS